MNFRGVVEQYAVYRNAKNAIVVTPNGARPGYLWMILVMSALLFPDGEPLMPLPNV